MKKLARKVALITGASTGIGAGVAIAFAKEGADVVINYPNKAEEKNAKKVANAVRKAGRKAMLVQADVAEDAPVKRMVNAVLKQFGRIDILVNNAGIAGGAMVEDMPVAMWDRMIAVNLRGVFLCTHYVLPHMYKRNYGKIINTASQLAYSGSPGMAHYCASKGAMISFTRSLAKEVGARNISVNCVAPGATVTPILANVTKEHLVSIQAGIPKGKLGEIDQIVPSFVFLADDANDHYVGQTISPNGGDVFL